MTRSRCIALVVMGFAPALVVAQGDAPARKVRVAVMEIRSLGTDPVKAELLSEVALTEAASMPGFDVIGRSDIVSLLGFEKQKQVMGCAEDSNCLAEVGGALGVDFILIGSLGRIGNVTRIDLKLVDARKARVRNRIGVNVEGNDDKLVATVQESVRGLLEPETPRAREASTKIAAATAAAPLKTGQPDLQAKPEKAPASVSSRATIPAAPREPGVARPRRTWAYVVGGLGVALLAGGAVAGLSARSAYDDEKAAGARGDVTSLEDNKSKTKSMSLVADGLFASGALGVGIGSWLFFSSRSPRTSTIGVAPAPAGAFAYVAGGF